MKGYKTSMDYKLLKELLDEGHRVVVLWVHSSTLRLFAGIAERCESRDSFGSLTIGYHIDAWSWFPGISRESFEDKCKKIGIKYIIPDD